MRLQDSPDYKVGGHIVHNSVDIRLFEGEAIVNRHGQVVAYVEAGRLIRPRDQVFVMTPEVWDQLKGRNK